MDRLPLTNSQQKSDLGVVLRTPAGGVPTKRLCQWFLCTQSHEFSRSYCYLDPAVANELKWKRKKECDWPVLEASTVAMASPYAGKEGYLECTTSQAADVGFFVAGYHDTTALTLPAFSSGWL